MRHRRADVVAAALRVLDAYGLADLSMRRLAGELGVQPSALYHHVASKQELLAAVAAEIVARGRTPHAGGAWDQRVREQCRTLRDAMLAWRDGAEVVATVHALAMGPAEPGERLRAALADAGLDAASAHVAARTLLHFVFGHVLDEQTHLQAASAGAIGDAVDVADGTTFERGLDLVLAGVRSVVTA